MNNTTFKCCAGHATQWSRQSIVPHASAKNPDLHPRTGKKQPLEHDCGPIKAVSAVPVL